MYHRRPARSMCYSNVVTYDTIHASVKRKAHILEHAVQYMCR